MFESLLVHRAPLLQGYIAPEILHGEYYSYPVDMWDVGMVIFYLLHGKSPFW